MGGQQIPATSAADAESAREATGGHAAIAESVERAMPAESSPLPDFPADDPGHGEE
jgi:hypothetical protein